MMTNLFSVFDPSTSFINLNWTMLLFPSLIITLHTLKHTKLHSTANIIKNTLFTITSNMPHYTSKKSTSWFFASMMMLIFLWNLLSLFPFTFTITAHLNINFMLTVSSWLSFMLMANYMSPMKFLIHLTPPNTPSALMILMCMIEMVSILIRPITLSIRLTANLMAGHILIILMTSAMMENKMLFTSLLNINFMLLILEIGISFIQAYVFSTLISLYYIETH